MEETIWKVVRSTRQKEKWDTHERRNGSYKSSVGSGSGLWAFTIRCWMLWVDQQQRCSLLRTNLSICLSLFLSFSLFLFRFSASRSTVRRLLKRISHDRLTVILRDPLRSIQVSLSASIYVIACLLFRMALTNREGWWILIAGALACSFSISFSSVFCNILMTLRSTGCSY